MIKTVQQKTSNYSNYFGDPK